MKIRILQIGKTKDAALASLIDELLKRIGGFAKIEIVTLAEAKTTETFGRERAVEIEGEAILAALREGEAVFILDEKGKEFTSKEFSEVLAGFEDQGQTLCFVIGGPFGLSEAVRGRGRLILSMSKMTFTHQMVRVFLLEQIYRGFCIIRGKEYHHE